jgi:hypothetical protein
MAEPGYEPRRNRQNNYRQQFCFRAAPRPLGEPPSGTGGPPVLPGRRLPRLRERNLYNTKVLRRQPVRSLGESLALALCALWSRTDSLGSGGRGGSGASGNSCRSKGNDYLALSKTRPTSIASILYTGAGSCSTSPRAAAME